MAYTVTIKYNGVPTAQVDKFISQICGIFDPKNSYIDTAAYEGTVYDTNVEGFGTIEAVEPFATTSVPYPVALAQFKTAVVGTDNTVEFTVDDYKEAFYYMTIGEQLADQGFEVTVVEAE